MKNQFLIGCCYYPEHWDENSLQYDINRIKDLGFNTIRMGEFSWSMYEKEEGKYDFSFLKKAVKVAGSAGLNVILGTPTAAPPKWLTDKYPEVLCADSNGILMSHGSRQHHNHTSEIYLKYCEAITEAMLKEFCSFKNIIGWQIDNEFNCHRDESYSEADDIAFRKWLENKYGTIEKLNEAWGNRFWSLEFNDFSQIQCQRQTTTYKNPSLMTDYYLFLSDSIVNYASIQTGIIRKYMPDAFITHNGFFENIDYQKLTDECLDILSYDSYPSFRERNGKAMGRNVSYLLSLTRCYSEKFLILEQEAGPGGQLSYMLPTARPGQIRLWTYQSIAYGAVGVLYFRYRTALYGAEQLWHGIYDHDGEENYRSIEIRQTAEEINRLGELFINERQHNQVAIFRDYHNICNNKTETFVEDDCWDIFMTLNHKNIHADFIHKDSDFSKYKVIIFPHIVIADEILENKINSFSSSGGIAIISARSGTKDLNAHYRPQKAPGVFRELCGCRVDWFTAMPEYEKQYVQLNEKKYLVESYYEMLEVEDGESIGCYTEGFCKEKTAVVKNKNVYYLGFYCRESADIYAEIIREYIDVSENIDENLEEIIIGDYKMYLNYGDYEIPYSGYDIITEKEFDSIPPYGVILVVND